ncbi:hypothetical protein BDEG_25743 [Batrachochytrium dendrobatidis JEL423]|uniref:Uncharacterized protein n=1 Tax=Batrachochytrium dendrobatidis (strain JEL423) TaxID=403673 RepID=A0A177WSE2_BATDL|nr:hypothetical protein BDEG_25743 [Batrachochytrium dendrobatidis JEL423]
MPPAAVLPLVVSTDYSTPNKQFRFLSTQSTIDQRKHPSHFMTPTMVDSQPTTAVTSPYRTTSATSSAAVARFAQRARTSHPSNDIMPGFEEKLQRNHIKLNPGFVLQDGFAFMAYGAQAIAQSWFTINSCIGLKSNYIVILPHTRSTLPFDFGVSLILF